MYSLHIHARVPSLNPSFLRFSLGSASGPVGVLPEEADAARDEDLNGPRRPPGSLGDFQWEFPWDNSWDNSCEDGKIMGHQFFFFLDMH